MMLTAWAALLTIMSVGGVLSGELEDSQRIELSILQGRLSGIVEKTVKGRLIHSFKNIPFAKPPVGALRFKDPVPAGEWKGIRNASSFPPRCIQQPYHAIFSGKRLVDGVEDCLYLNVYTPEMKVQSSLPVMVYFYGGGFFGGESFNYRPYVLLDRDVVLVVIQYRVGIFGFLSTEDEVIPGNFGLKDQTLALRWVQQNIGFFGGDPDRVTLFGQSAGSVSIHHQMLIPEAKGLFSRAILQGGSALSTWAVDDSHAKIARIIGQTVDCPVEQRSEVLLECLLQIPAIDLIHVAIDFIQYLCVPFTMVPRVDGSFLPDRPEVLVASGRFHRVPLISGVTAHEGSVVTHYMFSSEERRLQVHLNISIASALMHLKAPTSQEADDQVQRAFEHFIGEFSIDHDNADLVTQIFSDFGFFLGHDLASMLHSRYHPVYAYELEHKGQRTSGQYAGTEYTRRWVSHGDELFYLYEGGIFQPLEKEEDLAMREVMLTLWTNFAATGNPTPDDALGFRWEKVDKSFFQHLVLKPQPYMEDDTRKERLKFWLSLPALQHLKRFFEFRSMSEL